MKVLIALAVFALLGAAPTWAAPLAGSALADRVAGATLRTSIWSGAWPEYHLWRFRPDGTVTGIYHASRLISRGTHHIEEADSGRWQIEGDLLCIQFRRWLRGERHCFTVDTVNGDFVRLHNAGRTLEGTLNR